MHNEDVREFIKKTVYDDTQTIIMFCNFIIDKQTVFLTNLFNKGSSKKRAILTVRNCEVRIQ